MRKKYINIVAVYILVVASSCLIFMHSYAEDVSAEIVDRIIGTLELSRPDLNFGDVKKTAISGLYLIRVNTTEFIYAGETGEYVIAGDMYQAKPEGFSPVISAGTIELRKNNINAVPIEDIIVFPSIGEANSVLYVFTDVDCHFCRKFHNETLPALSLQGVEVRYLAYPRAGVGSDSYKKMASAWCAKDRKKALSSLKNRETIIENVCNENPIAIQYNLGKTLGITGTPSILLENGTLLMGYRPAKELLKIIKTN